MVKKFSGWQKGDWNVLGSLKMGLAFEKAGRGVKKPTAIESKRNKSGRISKWRIYHKPIGVGEFWD